MTPSADELADRLAIADGLARYAWAVDERDVAAVRDRFTPDAHLDYTASGGPAGPRDEVVDWMAHGLSLVGPTQHLVTTTVVDLAGDTATSRCHLLNPLLSPDDPASTVVLLGGTYVDQWRRTPDGWRITHRVHGVTWTRTLPA